MYLAFSRGGALGGPAGSVVSQIWSMPVEVASICPDFFVLAIQSPIGAQSTLYCVYGPCVHVGGAPPRSREPWARGPKPPQQWRGANRLDFFFAQ